MTLGPLVFFNAPNLFKELGTSIRGNVVFALSASEYYCGLIFFS